MPECDVLFGLKDMAAALVTLVAAFAGAFAAFLLEGGRRKSEIVERNCGAANRALYTLYSLWNTLEQYRKEALEQQRGKDGAWLNLAAHPSIPTGECKFQVSEIQFLLGVNAEVFATLMLEEQRFALAIDLIRSRSELMLNDVFRRMSDARIRVGQSVPIGDLERVLGVDLTHKLKTITDAIYKNVDEDLCSLRLAYSDLRKAMKEQYPKRKFLQIEFEVKSS